MEYGGYNTKIKQIKQSKICTNNDAMYKNPEMFASPAPVMNESVSETAWGRSVNLLHSS
jgi:hypothetical protein